MARPGSCVRRLAGTRRRQVQFERFLHNGRVTVADMAAHAGAQTGARVTGRRILAIQDTSDLVFGGKRARQRGFGPVGGGGALGGLCLHAMLAVDADSGALIGLVDATVWNRSGGARVTARSRRAFAEKESVRWLDSMRAAGERLAAAAEITVVADRESDIYETFAERPGNLHLIVRAGQNRLTAQEQGEDVLLFAFADGLPERDRVLVTLPAAPGRPARTAGLALRFAPVAMKRPKNRKRPPGGAHVLPGSLSLTLVDVREVDPPPGVTPVHWRLLTTHRVETTGEARWVLDGYRRRWIIEEFFRTLKTGGFDIEDAAIETPEPMMRLVVAAVVAAVTVLQLVKARDGATGQLLTDAFDIADQPILQAVSRSLEGPTARQKNPHPQGSLAFAAWTIARLGGWDGYYGKPGPLVMRRGLHDFNQIRYGANLDHQDV